MLKAANVFTAPNGAEVRVFNVNQLFWMPRAEIFRAFGYKPRGTGAHLDAISELGVWTMTASINNGQMDAVLVPVRQVPIWSEYLKSRTQRFTDQRRNLQENADWFQKEVIGWLRPPHVTFEEIPLNSDETIPPKKFFSCDASDRNHLLGNVGENFVRNFFTDIGFEIYPNGKKLVDFELIDDQRSRYLIEVKTHRGTDINGDLCLCLSEDEILKYHDYQQLRKIPLYFYWLVYPQQRFVRQDFKTLLQRHLQDEGGHRRNFNGVPKHGFPLDWFNHWRGLSDAEEKELKPFL